MPKIIAYQLAQATEEPKLVEQVNELLKKGWQPHGSLVFVMADKTDERGQYDWFVQPMVKFAEASSEDPDTELGKIYERLDDLER